MKMETIAFRVGSEDRALLVQLAQREERTPSDVLRRLIRQAAKTTERPARAEAFSVSATRT